MSRRRHPSSTDPGPVNTWSQAQVARFALLWNDRARLPQFTAEFGLASMVRASHLARKLRERGIALIKRRGTPPRGRRHARRDPRADRAGLVIPGAGSDIRPAIVMDAAGRPIATMDPVTRARRPIRRHGGRR